MPHFPTFPPISPTIYPTEEPHDPASPVRGEQAVWRAVITQALMDASSHSHKPEARFHKREAIEWLTGGSRDFITVCEHAGLEPSYVKQMAKRALANDCQWRTEPKRQNGPRRLRPGLLLENEKARAAMPDVCDTPPSSFSLVIPFSSLQPAGA